MPLVILCDDTSIYVLGLCLHLLNTQASTCDYDNKLMDCALRISSFREEFIGSCENKRVIIEKLLCICLENAHFQSDE
jgi:hypothetical protein